MNASPSVPPVDAFVLVSFGGPEAPDDVMPFLRNVTKGRNVPDERLTEVAGHYHHFGGVSPINEQNRALLAAIGREFGENGLDLPVYWGNRNWHPLLTDMVSQMRADGVRHAVAFVTSAYASYSACRQYRDDIDLATLSVSDAPLVSKLPLYYDRSGFIDANAAAVREALARIPANRRTRTRIVFTAHSIPTRMNAASGSGLAPVAGVVGGAYERQLRQTAAAVIDRVEHGKTWDLVWQSRSGAPHVPWLEPDINDHLVNIAKEGATDVVVSPIGFVSDHMEVVWDLDEEAAATARDHGLNLVRAATAGTHPAFVTMIRELTQEAISGRISGCTPGCCVV